jgi:peptidoglycan/xylan/chitin deacetylase (PgdA/CDA1 family)
VTIDGTTLAAPVEPPRPVEPGWSVLSTSDPTPRHSLYRRLAAALRPLHPRERELVTTELRRWASLPEEGRPTHRSLGREEVVAIGSSELVEIGAHTVGHPVLARLSAAEQEQEISGSRDTLRELVGRPVDSFAYPYGGADDFGDGTVAILEAQGFRRACATASEPVRRRADPFRIPRLVVRNWDGSELAARLAPFLAA